MFAMRVHAPVQSLAYQPAPNVTPLVRMTTAWALVSTSPFMFATDAIDVHTFGVPVQFAPALIG